VERRLKKRVGSDWVPVSGDRPASSWKPAFKPSPRSSTPRMPKRLVLLPLELKDLTLASPFFT
jgi:hypothetical protein